MNSPNSDFTRSLLGAAPSLRAFAISLTGHIDRADDLVQETLMKAWANSGSFTEGTNLRAWLFTILRNSFTSNYRKMKREVEDAEGEYAATLASPAEQDGKIALDDMKTALLKLPTDQREAVLLVGASGYSYEEAADICGCAVGTIKSRVNRGRVKLAELMYGEHWSGTPE